MIWSTFHVATTLSTFVLAVKSQVPYVNCYSTGNCDPNSYVYQCEYTGCCDVCDCIGVFVVR